MTVSSELFLYITYLVTLVELTLGFYMYVNNPRGAVSRNVMLLLIGTALNSLGLGLLNSAQTELQAAFPAALLGFSTLSIQPLLLLTSFSIFVKTGDVLERNGSRTHIPRWRVWVGRGLYLLAALPLLLVLFDLTLSGGFKIGFQDNLKLPILFFSGITPGHYLGGYLPLSTYTQGVLGMSLRLLYLLVLPFLLLCMSIYFGVFDRSMSKRERWYAAVYILVVLVATPLLFVRGDPSSLPYLVLISSITYAVAYSYTAYQQLETPIRVQSGSLVNRIALLVLVVSLPLMVALVLYTSSRAGALISSTAEQALQQQSQSLSASIDSWLELNYRILGNLSRQDDIRSMDPGIQMASLQATIESFPYMDLISISDPFGAEVARSDRGELEISSARRWFREIMDGKALAFQILLGRDGKPVLVVASPILDESDHIAGVVKFEAPLEEISEQLQTVSIGRTGTIFLIDEQNQLIAHPDPTETSWLRDYGEYPPVQWLNSGQTGFINYLCQDSLCDLQNDQRTAYVSRLSNGWGLIVEQSDIELFAPLQQIQQLAFVMLVVGLFLFAGAVTYTVRRGLAPVKILTDTVSAIADGDLERRVPLETGRDFTTTDELGFLAQTFNTMTSELSELIGGLEHRIEERTQDVKKRSAQLEAAARVARAAAEFRDLNSLLTQTSHLISETFGFYHTGIFILDGAREFAVLQASNSAGGQRMLARGHKLRVGQVGIVGFAASTAKPRIALDVGEDAVFFNNPDLPETRSEMALPLIVNEQVIGVLDVQSEQAQAFASEDLDVLQLLADQLALAIENTRLFVETNRALTELRSVYGARTREDWQDRLRRGPIIYEYNRFGVARIPSESLHPEEAGQSSPASMQSTDISSSHRLEIPITFRDQKLGVIAFHREKDQSAWNSEEMQIAQEAVSQIAAALENARLLEESQARSTQLRLLQEVTAVAASHTNLKGLLDNVSIRLRSGLGMLHCGVIMLDRQTWGLDRLQLIGTLISNDSADLHHTANQMVGRLMRLNAPDPTESSVFEKVMKGRTTSVIYAVQQAFPPGVLQDFVRQRGTATLLVSPLTLNEDVVGFLLLDSDRTDRFYDREDLQLIDQLSLQISSAMDVANSFEQTTLRAERERRTSEISSRIRETLDIDLILRTAADEVRQLLDVPEVTVQLVKPEEKLDA